MGDSYKLPIDGTGGGSLYGLAWSHPNAGGQASLGLNDHGLLVMNYGTTFAGISSRIWARDQMNAPIYYDRNTAFYVDGDSNSRLNHGRFVGSSGYYSLLLGPDTLATNGSTSIYPDGDRYGLVLNAPYYPHLYINSYADNGNTTHGGVLSFIGNLTAGGYRKFVMGIANRNPNELSFGWFDNNYNPHYGVGINWSYPASVWYDTGHNWYARGSMRAPIFYDQDNTGYYVNPNGYSEFGTSGHVMTITKLGTGPNSRALQVANNQGDNSWGIVSEFRVNGGPGGDRPSIMFSSGFDNNTWSCGFGYADSGLFRINYDHGHRNGSWGTTSFYIDRGGNSYSNGSSRAPIFYDQNDTSWYADPNSNSNLQFIECRRYGFRYPGGDSGLGADAYNLFQEGGGWGYPYPDLRIAYHTGIKLGANASYEGTRIYDDYPMGTLRYQFNGGAGYQYQYTWTQLTGHHGIYSGINGAHWYPNNSTYGSWRCDGSRNGYHGILIDAGNTPVLMFDGGGNGGIYYQSGRWMFYHYWPYNCVGVNTSSTSPSYGMYVSRGIYATENIVAYSDRRAKENIITIDSALDKLLQMRGVYYNRIDDETKKRQIGVIAQEVNEIIPEAVTYCDVNDEYGVAYGNLAGLFIESIKDQQLIIDKQAQEISLLKEELQKIKDFIFNNKG
jgi:hypothetical protein